MNYKNLDSYLDAVITYLEHLEYPEMTIDLDDKFMSMAISCTVLECYKGDISVRMAAIVIWSNTMRYYIPESLESVTKH